MNGEENTRGRWLGLTVGTIEVARSDDTECVACRGRSYDGNDNSNSEHVPVWIELISISFGCVGCMGEFAFRRLGTFPKRQYGGFVRICHSRPQIRAPMTNEDRARKGEDGNRIPRFDARCQQVRSRLFPTSQTAGG